MTDAHLDHFYDTSAEIFALLYAAFPVRHMLLVEEISGPIRYDMTGLPDRRSRATFETMIWLGECGLLKFRSIEPRDVGVEGAVLTQHAFVLLTDRVRWECGPTTSRIDALHRAQRERAYSDVATILRDLFHANCLWSAPRSPQPLVKSPGASISIDEAG